MECATPYNREKKAQKLDFHIINAFTVIMSFSNTYEWESSIRPDCWSTAPPVRMFVPGRAKFDPEPCGDGEGSCC